MFYSAPRHQKMFSVLIICLINLHVVLNQFIDVNDILNENLMPGSLLFLEGTEKKNLTEKPKIIDDGTLNKAFSTMGFHRKMINEYLCTNFIANEILDDLKPSDSMFGHRIGTPYDAEKNKKLETKDNMLYDQGSSGYKDWLSK